MHARWTPAAILFVAIAPAAFAAPATSQGARAIEQGYADVFSRAVVDQGVVSVAPEGEDYVVVWDLQKALDLAGAPKGALRVERFSYRLTPRGDGAWTVAADRFPTIAFDVATDKGETTGTLDLAGFRLATDYDAAQTNFLRSLVGADSLAGKFHVVEPDRNADFDLVESGVSVETHAKTSDSGVGVDVAVAQSVNGLNETIFAPPPSGQGGPVKMTYSVGAIAGGAAISALRAREIGNWWKYVVAHVDDADVPAQSRLRLRAALPLWNDLKTNGQIHDVTLQTPMADLTVKMIGETIALSGFTADGAAEIGVKIDALTFNSPLLPPWTGRLSPASLSFDLSLAGKGLDRVAALALDDPGFDGAGELSAQTQDAIDEVLLAGRPKLTLAPGRFKTPTLDLTFEGEALLETGGPSGHFTFTADGLDSTIALLSDIAGSQPDLQPAMLGLIFVKGLATTGADGRLVWKVDVTDAGEVSVNGTPLPTAK